VTIPDAWRFTVAVAANARRIESRRPRLDGTRRGPGAKKAETNAFTPVVGWNTVNVVTPVALSPGTYWLAYLPQSNSLRFKADRSTGQIRYDAYPFAPMPATFSTSTTSEVTHWSLFGTLTP
jgi:hypothetical protein